METVALSSRKAARTYQVLDPRTLGRPVHLLDKYTERFRKDLIDLFQAWFNRRYRAQFEIGALRFEQDVPASSHRWLNFRSDAGSIAFCTDRKVLLCILAYRYGVSPSEMKVPSDINEWNERETATEQRLASRLGRQLVAAAAAAIEGLQSDASAVGQPQEFTPSATAIGDGAWTLSVAVTEQVYGLEGTLRFRFDEEWIGRLMRALAPRRERREGIVRTDTQPLPSRLRLTLNARLIEKQIDLGTLLDLRVGDVIPVTVASADVLIGDSHLFTASVAEHKGKLCLTCFEDVE
ncbi:MAG: FliM/FliN family flagellar motor C-terminal domain-containing protein [Gammaproteobacteria bacterium]|nr:hypothetical protein [Gammaproteobacteria bacterium]